MTAFGIKMAVGAARLQQFWHANIPVFCTYHPSYVMMNEEKGKREPFNIVVGDIKRFLKFKPEDAARKLDVVIIDMFGE